MKKGKIKRILSGIFAAMVAVTAVPVTGFASISADVPEEMRSNIFLDALAYTGYDVQAQINDGSLYNTVGGAVPSSVLSNITYSSSVYPTGLEKTADGKPDISYFEENGLVCGSYVSYVLFNYLPNVAGIDMSSVKIPDSPASVGYYALAAEQWVSDGVATKIYSADYGTSFNYSGTIPIGSVIIMAGQNSDGEYSLWNAGHVCLYAGYYNGHHYVTHVGNSRGPEISRIDYLEKGDASGKSSRYVVSVYALNVIEQKGYIEVNKSSEDGKNLSGAVFVATNDSTGDKYRIGPTNNSGYAKSVELPYGDYTIKETVFPTGYTKGSKDTWNVTVSKNNNGVVTINAVNKEKTGTLKVIKTSEDDYVSGIEFNLKGTSLTGKTVNLTAKTNAEGVATFNEVPITGSTPYTLTEVNVADRYEPVSSLNVTIEWEKTTETGMHNTLKKGWIEINKSDKDTSTLLANAKYGIYSDSACTKLVTTVTTDSKGYAKSKALPIGDYYIKEITAPEGYVLDINSYKSVVAYNKTTSVYRTDKEQYGAITIYKEGEVLTDWNGTDFVYETKKLPGVTFKITAGADIYRADGTLVYHKGDLVKDNLVTGQNGSVTLSNLHLGTYTVTETKSIPGFTRNTIDKTVKIEYKDQTVSVQYEETTVANQRQKAEVNVVKKDSDTKNGLTGGEFTLYADTDIVNYEGKVIVSGGTALETVTTAGGTAKFRVDIPINNSYHIAETKAPYGYVRNKDDVYSFTFDYISEKDVKETFSHTFVNDRVNAKITLTKIDNETGKTVSQGDAKLSGAIYGIYARNDIVHPDGTTGVMYKAGTLVTTIETDNDAKATAENLYLGNYYLKEIKVPIGYLPDEEEYDLVCNYEGDLISEITRSTVSREQVYKQPFQLIKVAYSCGDTEGELLSGAGFTAYLKSDLVINDDGSYDFEASNPIVIGDNGEKTLFTDDNGYVVTTAIPYGTYVVVESVTPHNYKTIKPFEVTVSENLPDKPQMWRVFMDKEFDAKLRIYKKDADTQKNVLLPNASFKIYNCDTDSYVTQVTTYPSVVVHDTFITDDDGDLILPEALKVGNYRIEEVAAPDGYVINTKPVYVKVDTDTFYEVDEAVGAAIINVEVIEQPVTGKLTVKKTGEVLVDYKNDEFIYETKELAGAVFEVYAATDIVTADNQKDESGNRTLYYKKDELVATITTGQDGTTTLDKLPLGTYRIVEAKAPTGYVLNGTEQTVTFEYADDKTPVVFATADFNNDRQKNIFRIIKKDIESDNPLANAEFTLYAGEDIMNYAGDVIVQAGTELEKSVSDNNGMVIFNKDYPFAIYNAEETKQPDGYISNNELITFTAAYKDQTIPVVEYEAEMLNTPTIVEISKTDIVTGEEIPGATLTILNEDGNVVDSWISIAGESHIIKGLTVGETYTLREEMAPYGYLKAEDVEFMVTDTADIQKVTMKDDVPTGTIIIHKIGEVLTGVKELSCGNIEFQYEKQTLSGVSFDIYAYEDIIRPDGSGEILLAKDELVGTITTNEEGIAIIDFLPVGKYYVVEKNTIDGFVLDDSPAVIDISYADQNTNVVYCDKTIENMRQKVKVAVKKTDSKNNEPLASAIFGIYSSTDISDADGILLVKAGELIESEKSDENGLVTFMSDLPLGCYYVMEISAPAGYVKSDEVIEVDALKLSNDISAFELEAEVTNDRITIEFTKTDITGNHEIEGARLSIIDEFGNTVHSWTSAKETHIIEMLPAGKYILREESAPYGYMIAEDVVFEVAETDEVQKVIMKDDTPNGKIIINKTDKHDGKPLAGVEFEIRNEAGEVIETLITDENGHAESNILTAFTYIDGKYDRTCKYTVVETKTVEGYKLDNTE